MVRMADQERALIRGLKRGEPAAFRSFYEHYHQQVYSVAYRFFADHHLAEDITQDVFLHLFERLARPPAGRHGRQAGIKGFRGESKISTYLYRVVTNFCINRARTRAHKGPISGTPGERARHLSLEQIPEVTAQREGLSVEAKEKKTRAQQALLHLSEEHRAVLILKAQEGLTYKEVAEVTGLSRIQVRGRLYRARKAFKKKYDEFIRRDR